MSSNIYRPDQSDLIHIGRIVVSAVVAVAFVAALDVCIRKLTSVELNEQLWFYSEWLINYQGGFVRRGLPGELLYRWSELTGYTPLRLVVAVCLVAFVLVMTFMIRAVRGLGLKWWLWAMPYGLVGVYLIRKDFVLLCLAIVLIYLAVRRPRGADMWYLLIAAVAMLIHEVFFFMAVPLTLLLMFRGQRLRGVISALVLCGLMLLLLVFKGSVMTPWEIQSSWHGLRPDRFALTPGESVMAIGWNLEYALYFNDSILCPGRGFRSYLSPWGTSAVQLLIFCLGLWLLSTYFTNPLSRTGSRGIRVPARGLAVGVICVETLSLMPMFLGLSCDWGRLFLYLTVMTVAVLYIAPAEDLECALGRKFIARCSTASSFLGLTPWWFYGVAIISLGIPFSRFLAKGIWQSSPLGVIVRRALDYAHAVGLIG